MSVAGKNVKKNGIMGRKGTILSSVILVAALVLFTSQYFNRQSDASQVPIAAEQKLPAVVVQNVEMANLALTKDYIGRVEAIQTVDIKPQVTGEIAKVHFNEGSFVKEGAILFTLDSKQYQATVDLRKADLEKAEANYNWAVQYHSRLKSSDKRSIPASDIDAAENNVNQGKAAISQAKAALRIAQIDLGYTKITAPISGRIGKARFTKGNYVTPASGPLATLVQVDPIRISFSVPDRNYLDSIEAFTTSRGDIYNIYKTTITLPNGDPYPFSGARDFEDNVMNTQTGTIEMRLRIKNNNGALVPGSMVNVRTEPVTAQVAPVIPQEGIMSDAEGDFVYTVNTENVIQQKRIEVGKEVGTMTEIRSGLQEGERVVIRGLQSVRPDARVRPISQQNETGGLSPAEQAMESGYDLMRAPSNKR